MGESLVIKNTVMPNLWDKEKYWELVIRNHDLGGTDYEHVCYLNNEQAEKLVELSKGITFLHSINWDEVYKRQEKWQLQKQKVEIEKRLQELNM